MSALTKLFVVLLVVCSLLLSGAVVVFVNKVDDHRKNAQKAGVDLARAQADMAREKQRADAAETRERETLATKDGIISGLRNDVAQLNKDLDAARTDLNGANTRIAVLDASLLKANEANAAHAANVKDMRGRNEGLVAEADQLRTRNAELVAANTDLTKRLDESDRERRWQQEQIAQLRSDLGQAHKVLIENRLDPKAKVAPRLSARPLEGVIRSVKMEDGIPYATISLGAAQKVEKGMEFKILSADRNEFLGVLTIEAVDNDEAFGRLSGPNIQQVRANLPVKTQL